MFNINYCLCVIGDALNFLLKISRYSKQAFLNDVQNPFTLPDGTPSFMDYGGSRNNRFSNPEAASKNRILPPSKMLHFFNAPFGITEEQVHKVTIIILRFIGKILPQ